MMRIRDGIPPLAALAASLLVGACGSNAPSMTDQQVTLSKGEAVFTTCAGCHGNAAQGRDYMYAPNLTGLAPDYFTRQLHNFRDGRRGKLEDPHGFQMVGRAAAIGGEANLDAVVAYVGSLPDKTPVDLATRAVPAGIAGQVQACAACHGADGGGNSEMGGPALTTLDKAYIARQLRKFRDGLRGYAEDDAQGQVMAASAQAIPSEADIDPIASYYGY